MLQFYTRASHISATRGDKYTVSMYVPNHIVHVPLESAYFKAL